ncbi:MAG: molecular chaperone, partial [Rhodospirillales bacterium]|nr:molecular chaperone [Rhodospirillales bacterium]
MPSVALPPVRRRALALTGIALALCPRGAEAGALSVAPLSVELGAGRRIAALEVANRGAAAVAVQIRAFAWSQAGEEDRLAPTSDLLVSPTIARLGPSEEQVVRVALRRPPGAEERTYRLLLDELPDAAEAARRRAQIQVALRFSLPVLVRGTAPASPALSWRL